MHACSGVGKQVVFLLVIRVAIPPSLVCNEATVLHLIILFFILYFFNFSIQVCCEVTETLSNAKLDVTTFV